MYSGSKQQETQIPYGNDKKKDMAAITPMRKML